MLDSIESLVLTIISFLIIIIFGGSIFGFFRSIYLFIFSGGDQDKVKEAWNGIRYMILGIFLTFLFLFIFPIIFQKIGLQGAENYTAQNIFSHTSKLLRSILDLGKDISSGGGFQSSPANGIVAPSSQPAAQPIEL